MHRAVRPFVLICFVVASSACGGDGDPGTTSLENLPGSISQSVVEGGPNADPLVFTVANPGTCQLAFTLEATTADGKPWLSVTPVSGNVAPSAEVEISVTLDVVATALPPGTYTGSILATGTCTTNSQPADRSPRNVAVNLTVTPVGAVLDVSATTLGQDVVTLGDQWTRLSMNGAPEPTANSAAIYTGHELLFPVYYTDTPNFGRYSLGADAWATPSGIGMQSGQKAVWTGSKMILWGSTLPVVANNIVSYDRSTEIWKNVAVGGAPTERVHHSLVWTGSEMIAWGGLNSGGMLKDGKRYDPAVAPNGQWNAMYAVPAGFEGRALHSAVWTGSEMIVWGGGNAPVPGPTSALYGNGARYSPANDSWTLLPTANAPEARSGHTAVWTGSRMIVWGGMTGPDAPSASGRIYLPAQNEWRPMATSPLAPRSEHSAVWTGAVMIVWGGLDSTGAALADGAIYDPIADAWTPMTSTGAPAARRKHHAVWTGSGMLILGGEAATGIYRRSLYLYR